MGRQVSLQHVQALLRLDLSELPKLESIPAGTFAECRHFVSVLFGEHSNIANLGMAAFANCTVLTSITLPYKLTIIEELTFTECKALERVVWNKNLKTIGEAAFQLCSNLEDVQLASSSISFGAAPFAECDRLIELAAAAGFPSIPELNEDDEMTNF